MNYTDKIRGIKKEIRRINKFYQGYKYQSLTERETEAIEGLRQKEVSAAFNILTEEEWSRFEDEQIQKLEELRENKV